MINNLKKFQILKIIPKRFCENSYKSLLKTKGSIKKDMMLREIQKNPTKKIKLIQNQLTKPPLPLKYKLQDLPENHNPLTPIGNTEKLPFFIERTNSQNLPVYRDSSHGGAQKMTIVRKITGDVEGLMEELQKVCSNSDVKAHVGKVVVKGYHKEVIWDYLIRLGF